MLDRRITPYIGITGFAHTNELWGRLHDERVRCVRQSGRMLMVGVLASLKTLTYGAHRRPNRYPDLRLIGRLFDESPETLNLIHYHTTEPESLGGQLTVLYPWGGEHCHGVQLNNAWPDAEEVSKFRKRHPQARIVLQCGSKALRQLTSAADFINRLRIYDDFGLIDDVLLDPSGGEGRPFNPTEMMVYFEAIQEAGYLEPKEADGRIFGHPLGLGVAGGLSADNTVQLNELLVRFPQLSTDAEGLLRNTHDDLDVQRATLYVRQVTELIKVDPSPAGTDA